MGQDRKLTFKRMDEIDARTDLPRLQLKGAKYAILSDLHLGDGKKADDLRLNEPALRDALARYCREGFRLILLGDVEELWQFDLKQIVACYGGTVYADIRRFGEGRVARVFGNHDVDWRSLPDPVRPAQPGAASAVEAVRLVDEFDRVRFLLVHGHQGSAESDKASWSSRFFVRLFRYVEPLCKKLGISAHPPALRAQITKDYDRIFYDWAKLRRVSVICGHSHRAIFASKSYFQRCLERLAVLGERLRLDGLDETAAVGIREEMRGLKAEIRKEKRRGFDVRELDEPGQVMPCYYNSGCALFSDGITGIEIEDGEIRLVKWERDRRAVPDYQVYQRDAYP